MDYTDLQKLAEAYASVYSPQEEVEMDEAMRPGERQRKVAAKVHDPYVKGGSKTRAIAHNVAVRNDGPGTPGYEKKSTGGKGARYAGYGDQGAGNKARRRMGQEPLRGNTRKEELEAWADAYKAVYEVDEEAKPDYLDFDKDGNKKESMKKALKDKKKGNPKHGMKGHKCDDDCDHDENGNGGDMGEQFKFSEAELQRIQKIVDSW